jgi:peptidoglycan/xylan/chitin deacetylase (PgdA/CDA1 family)
MTFAFPRKLLRLGERLKARLVPGAIVLVYHRVAELASDPQLLSVTPRHFQEHLEILRRECRPTSLEAFGDVLRNRKVPERTVVVTMDDGYADNLFAAKPMLESFDIPATVFIAAGYVGSRREFWWDELERVFLQPGKLPDRLSLRVDGVERKYDLGHATSCGSDSKEPHANWNVQSGKDPSEHHRAYRSLMGLLRPLSERTRRDLMDQILAWAGVGSEGRLTHRMLGAAELLRLVDGGLIDVGAHSVSHSVLALLSQEEQRAEILGSKIGLEEIIGSKVKQFAYPYGSRDDYNQKTVALVQGAGFRSACANYPGLVWNDRHRYEWPRMLVRDWDGDEFANRLRRWWRGD